jgi:hypothetical protein
MLKRTGLLIFAILLLLEVCCKLTGYTYTFLISNILIKSYLIIFIIAIIIKFISTFPKPFKAVITIIFTLILIVSLIFTIPFFAFHSSGHFTVISTQTVKNYKVDFVSGQGWAGPHYENYKLYKTTLAGFLKKEIAQVSANLLNDSCIITFYTFHSNDTTKYIFDECKNQINIK